MTTPTLPTWWPPSGYEELSEVQVRELFPYLKTVIPPVMEDAKRRRIQARVGDDPIRVWPTTVKQLTGRRMGSFDALKIVHLAARTHDETASVEGTPERRQQEWQVWEPGAPHKHREP